jgi:hypothetical protein
VSVLGRLNTYVRFPLHNQPMHLRCSQNADNDLWEANRMVTSGVASRGALDLDFEDESESAVHVLVHELKPPFLDGRTVYTRQLAPINPVRDSTSDLAVFSKKGSALVREKREQAERAKAAAKLAALGGTALGNVMGVRDEEGEAAGKSLNCSARAAVRIVIHVDGSGVRGEGGRAGLQGREQVRRPPEEQPGREPLCEVAHAEGAARVLACVRVSRGTNEDHPRESRSVHSCVHCKRSCVHPMASRGRSRRDRFRKNHSAWPVPLRGRVRRVWHHWMHATSTCCGHVSRQTCV